MWLPPGKRAASDAFSSKRRSRRWMRGAATGGTDWESIALLYKRLVHLAPTIGALVGRASDCGGHVPLHKIRRRSHRVV